MINDELENRPLLEEYCYPINDVLLSSSSDVVNPVIMRPPPLTKGRSRSSRRNKNNNHVAPVKPIQLPPPPPPTDMIIPVGQPMEINGIKHEPLPMLTLGMAKNSCHICSKQFVHDYALRRHLASHNAQVFSCNQCNKTFKHQSTLTAHRASHTLNLPFTCDTCNKSFNRISTLKSHRRIHSGAKPFTCHVCNKAFYQKGNLKNHLYIHTNERPYRCDICSRGFNQMSNLVCHKKNAHRIPSAFYCQCCEMQFSRPEQLARHGMEVHLRQPAHSLNLSALETETQLVRVQTFIEEPSEEPEAEAEAEAEAVEVQNEVEEVVVVHEEGEVKAEDIYEPATAVFCEPLDLSHESAQSAIATTTTTTAVAMNQERGELGEGSVGIGGGGGVGLERNCQMVFEKTEKHAFFSKFRVIELPQKIDTLEMRYAEVSNKTPFAMLHFGEEAPCLVEIIQQRGMSILKPIKKHELGKFTFSEPDPLEVGANQKIVITIVATILQSFTKGEYSLFTVKSPEIVRCVKLLVDSDAVISNRTRNGVSLANCARADELRELKNKITIAMSDCRAAVGGVGGAICKEEPQDS